MFEAPAGEPSEMKRLRRIMAPRADGSYIVPQEIVDKWNDVHGGGRDSVVAMWDACCVNKDKTIWITSLFQFKPVGYYIYKPQIHSYNCK